MCGIAGVLRTWKAGEKMPDHFEAIPEAWLDVLDDSIKQRGPDGQGRFRHRIQRDDGTIVDVALVHRRLSIIDLTGGQQPMVLGGTAQDNTAHGGVVQGGTVLRTVNPTGNSPNQINPLQPHTSESSATGMIHSAAPLISRDGVPYKEMLADEGMHTCAKCGDGVLAVVFNGCIYNHRVLRQELEAAGHEFFSDHSDTEVLLHGWRQWGAELTDHLESMHAFAIWDSQLGQLIFGRDAFGEKPLSIGEVATNAPFLFSSNMLGLAILLNEGAAPSLDQESMVEWIRMGYDAEIGPFVNTMQLGPGDMGRTVEKSKRSNGLRREQKHALCPDFHTRAKRALPTISSIESLANKVDETLARAVADRLEADVPLGCLLSGGVDSSLLAHYANAQLDQQLTTICVRMPDAHYDESAYAQIAADRIGSKHIVVDADPNPADDLQLLIQTLGLPFGDSSLLPTWWACRAATNEVKVLLSGDGGDELFLGYERYAVMEKMIIAAFIAPVASLISLPLPRKHPKSKTDKIARLLHAVGSRQDPCYRELLVLFQSPDFNRLLIKPQRPPHSFPSVVHHAISAREYDLLNHLPGDMLRKVDTASMLAGVEMRAPFLDREVARLAMALPVHRLMPHGQRKGLLRKVARRYLPAEIIDRPKMGFAIPIGEWFRTDYGNMRQLLYDHLESADPFPGLSDARIEINMNFVQRMLREHDAAGEKSINPWHGRDHAQRLYMLLVLSIWCRWVRVCSCR